jgi:hypothetical protein
MNTTALAALANSIGTPSGRITANGIEWVATPTDAELKHCGQMLQAWEKSSPWIWGDFLCMHIDRTLAAEAKAKRIAHELPDERAGRMRQAVREYAEVCESLKASTLLEYLCVANFFPLLDRSNSLTYSHHSVCWMAGLSLLSAKTWLAKAATGTAGVPWSRSELAAQIRAAKQTAIADEEEPALELVIPRQISAADSWFAIHWVEIESYNAEQAAQTLRWMSTTAKAIDHLRAVAGTPVTGPS